MIERIDAADWIGTEGRRRGGNYLVSAAIALTVLQRRITHLAGRSPAHSQ